MKKKTVQFSFTNLFSLCLFFSDLSPNASRSNESKSKTDKVSSSTNPTKNRSTVKPLSSETNDIDDATDSATCYAITQCTKNSRTNSKRHKIRGADVIQQLADSSRKKGKFFVQSNIIYYNRVTLH